MSVLEHIDSESVWVLDHADFVRKLYADVALCSKNLFEIRSPFYMDLQAEKIAREMESGTVKNVRKRKRDFNRNDSFEADFVRKKFGKIKDSLQRWFEPPPPADIIRQNNREARDLVKELKNPTEFVRMNPLSGYNESDSTILSNVENTQILIPPKSHFFVEDLVNFSSDKKFDLILMDPPWENKHVKRANVRGDGYDVLSTDSMSSPLARVVENFWRRENGIILVWVSNSAKQQASVAAWAEAWKVVLRGKWFWLKVTKSGVPVSDLMNAATNQKLPFEMVWIFTDPGNNTKIPDCQLLVSVPSAVHSHKPPLVEVLRDLGLIKPESANLELFGRYLLPGWTTFGNEAVKFQELKYFQSTHESGKASTGKIRKAENGSTI